MSSELALIGLWGLFAATHMGMSSVRFRPRLVAALGETGFVVLYSVVAFAVFVPLVSVYFGNKHAGPWLWVLPRTELLLWVLYVGNAVAFTLLVASFVQASPASIGSTTRSAVGVLRITRHPTFMAIALWGLMHAVVNASLTDLLFFGGIAAFALLGAWHQDRRKLATGTPELREFYATTPFLPFTGSATLQGLREIPWLVWILGVGLTVALRVFHGTLFGP